jgi:DNA-binding XRE family transcriptional regulator
MITNERQYRITKAALARFENSLHALQNEPARGIHPRLQKAHRDAVKSEIEVLCEQLSEYEKLRSSRSAPPELALLESVPRALIRARIAAGMTQKDLADQLGVKEQQIQRYEATEYSTASLRRVREVAQLLTQRPKRTKRTHSRKTQNLRPAL